jgi:hypothetical protein
VNRTLSLWLALCSLAAAAPAAHAALSPLGLVVDGAPDPVAILLPYGLLGRGDGGAPWLTCWQRFDSASFARLSGARRVIVGGPSGPWNTNDDGCRFESTNGPADKRPVMGLYTPDPAEGTVLIAYDDGVAPSGVAVSTDGGITATQSGAMVFAEAGIRALFGDGDVVWAPLQARDGGAWQVWRSEDRAATAAEIPMGAGPPAGTAGLAPAAANAASLWFWQSGALVRLDTDGAWTVEAGVSVTDAATVAAVTSDGAVWFGSPSAGLDRLGPDGTVTHASDLPTAALVARGPALWVAHVAQAPGDPLVSYSGDLGATWAISTRAPSAIGHPPLCSSLISQSCAPAVDTLRAALDLEAPNPDASAEDPGPTASSGGCGAAPGAPPWLVALVLLVGYAGGAARRLSSPSRSAMRASSSARPRSAATS